MLRTALIIAAVAVPLVGLTTLASQAGEKPAARFERAGAVAISKDHAIDIARHQGLESVDDVALSQGAWRIHGETVNGRAMSVDISVETGGVNVLEYGSAPT